MTATIGDFPTPWDECINAKSILVLENLPNGEVKKALVECSRKSLQNHAVKLIYKWAPEATVQPPALQFSRFPYDAKPEFHDNICRFRMGRDCYGLNKKLEDVFVPAGREVRMFRWSSSGLIYCTLMESGDAVCFDVGTGDREALEDVEALLEQLDGFDAVGIGGLEDGDASMEMHAVAT